MLALKYVYKIIVVFNDGATRAYRFAVCTYMRSLMYWVYSLYPRHRLPFAVYCIRFYVFVSRFTPRIQMNSIRRIFVLIVLFYLAGFSDWTK